MEKCGESSNEKKSILYRIVFKCKHRNYPPRTRVCLLEIVMKLNQRKRHSFGNKLICLSCKSVVAMSKVQCPFNSPICPHKTYIQNNCPFFLSFIPHTTYFISFERKLLQQISMQYICCKCKMITITEFYAPCFRYSVSYRRRSQNLLLVEILLFYSLVFSTFAIYVLQLWIYNSK